MSAITSIFRIDADDSDRVIARVRTLCANWALEPDREENFPAARLAALGRAGALRAFERMAPGPLTASLRDVLRAIGGADLSLGRIFEGHVNAVQLVHAYGERAQAAGIGPHELLGVWATEPTPGMRIERRGQGWCLSGAKSFATGAGRLDRALITAKLPDGSKQLVLVRLHGHDARADTSGWRVRGMRGTCSGIFDFSGMIVDDEALIGAPEVYEREPRFSAGAWRFAAVQLGAVEALLRHWRDHLVATGKADDPIQRQRLGACIASTRSAALWVGYAAEQAERSLADAVPLVLMTRGIVEEAGLAVMEGAARGVGTASFFQSNPIDRITRDLGLYLRQPVPDQARDRAVRAWIEADPWIDDPWW